MHVLQLSIKVAIKFHWSLFLRDLLTIIQLWFRKWLDANQMTHQYLNKWCFGLTMHICITQPWWIDPFPPGDSYMHQAPLPDQCRLIVNLTLWNKLQWNSNQNTRLFTFMKMHLKMLSVRWQPYCSGGVELKWWLKMSSWHMSGCLCFM